MRTTTHHQGFLCDDEARPLPYRYVPFDVPAGCTRISASYHFTSDGAGPCTVDIGLFDVRGTDPLTGGFRGWSGGARRQFFVSRETATPGYLPGPLPSGTWSIILGFYEVPPPGVRWTVSIEIESREGVTEPPAQQPAVAVGRPSLPGREQGGWLRGDFHSHSEHSDGANSIGELAAFALDRGLDFLAITDHNTTSHHAEVDAFAHPRLLLVPGEEVTTYTGHGNVWGLREWADFRLVSDEEVHRLFRWVEERGAPFSMNHPKSVGPPWAMADPGFSIREVWQAPWRWYNWESVRDWDEALADGRRITPVGGSDAHSVPPAQPMHPHHIGDPTTWVRVEPGAANEGGILAAVLAGRTAISESPRGPRVTLDPCGEGFEASWERAGGCTLVFVCDGEPRQRVELGERDAGRTPAPPGVRWDRYLRAELRSPGTFPGDHEQVRALSSPVYQ